MNATQPDDNQLITLFNQGWKHFINHEWRLAEEIFAQIETRQADYEQNGLQASSLREKARQEQKAETAWQAGNLETALAAFKKADNFELASKVYTLLTIQELETKARRAAAMANYQEAAWIYEHLLSKFPQHKKEANWQSQKESCWQAELVAYFQIGVKALQQEQWLTAYKAFAQVLLNDPYFRQDGRSAAALSEFARKEIVLLADQWLRQGKVHQALEAYREVGHLARIENVAEFLRLRQREEDSAQQLEAAGKWHDAATKYKYLCTLYYDENGRSQWQAAASRCLEEARLVALYEQAMAALTHKRWREADKLLSQIVASRPSYQPGDEPVSKLLRTARWRSLFSRFTAGSNNLPPHIQTGKMS